MLRLRLSSVFLFQRFDVGQVLRPRGREFVFYQVFSGQHGDRLICEPRNHPVRPSFVELDAVDHGQDIDAYGFHADLKNDARCRKVFLRQVMQRGAEGAESFDDSLSVFRGRTNPNVEVLGCADMAVRGQGVSADEEKFNLSGVEFC